jgi:P27 family predicted phage terminase small subunit
VRGRKPKPVGAKIRDGNPRKEKLPSVAEQVHVGGEGDDEFWQPPAYLTREGKKHWRELLVDLRRSHIVETVDRGTLAQMCEAWSTWMKALAIVKREGIVSRGSTNQLVKHPAVQMMSDASRDYLRLAEQYGLTPSARARLDAFNDLGRDSEKEMEDEIGVSPRLRAIAGGAR